MIPAPQDRKARKTANTCLCAGLFDHARAGLAILASILALGVADLQAQLAITEAMSWASIDCGDCGFEPRGCHPDFWELTNFGSETVDIGGYAFSDMGAVFPGGEWRIPEGVSIDPDESVIFVREWAGFPTNAAAFREWWGENNLPAGLQIYFYPDHGFDEVEDAVRLWDINSNVVDQVYLPASRRGFTFTYDPTLGIVVQSELGMCGMFPAPSCGDVGSPGRASCGPVPLRIVLQPTSQSVDVGADVTFRVQAAGVPPATRYQWHFNGAPIPSPSAGPDIIPTVINYAGCGPAWTASPKLGDLVLSNAQPHHTGHYFVTVGNGHEQLASEVVTLTVNTNHTPPSFGCPFDDLRFPARHGMGTDHLILSEGQTAQFEVLAQGYPAPTLRWSWSKDGTRFTDLFNATNRSLTVWPAVENHSGVYRVRMQNAMGTSYAFATMTVQGEDDKPRLKITEVMADSRFVYKDWWELTNVGDEAVDLYGYRWDDYPGDIGGGPTVTKSVVVQPGESVIFLEGLTPEDFASVWWGADNLPPGLQFVRFTGNGLHYEGDEVNLWNPTATDPIDLVDSVAFSMNVAGSSFWFAPNDLCSEFGALSVAGDCGAFRSAEGSDVGSPGWTPLTPPRLTAIRRDGSDVSLEWKAQPGSTTLVQYTGTLSSPAATIWTDLGTYTLPSATATASATHKGTAGAIQLFYRVILISPAPCLCIPSNENFQNP